MVATPRPLAMLPDREQVIPMSRDEFLAGVADEAHAEWVDGEAIVFMSPKERHQALVFFLSMLIGNFVDRFGLGVVRNAPYAMRADPAGSMREPDLLFVAREHLDRITEDGLVGPADLVIEIVSEESLRRDRADKFYEYQDAGISEYWLFDPRPRRQRADFYRLNDQGSYHPVVPDREGRLYSSALPNFWLDPAWLWEEPLPSPLRTLSLIAPQDFPPPR